MPRGKRSRRKRESDAQDGVSANTPVDPDVARFAARTRQQEAAERDRKRAEREARQREQQHQTLIATKDSAANEVKRLRMQEHVKASDAAAAEAAYRTALADLIAFETGSAPAWAGSAGPDRDPVSEDDPDDGAEQAGGEATPDEEG